MLTFKEILEYRKSPDFYWRHIFTLAPLVDKAQQAEQDEDFEKAASYWRRLHHSRFRRLQGGLNLIRLHALGHEQKGIEQVMTSLKKEFPDKVNPWLESGKLFYRQKDFKRAFPDLEKAVLLRPDLESTVNQYIICSRELGETKRAYTTLKKAWLKDKESKHIFKAFVKMAMKAGDPELLGLLNEILKGKEVGDFDEEFALGYIKLIKAILSQEMMVIQDGEVTSIDLDHRKEIIENPKGRLSNWKQSEAARILDNAKKASSKKLNNRREKAKNVLFVSEVNWNFMRPIVESFSADENINVKTLEISNIDFPEGYNHDEIIARRAFSGDDKLSDYPVNQYWAQLFEWADVVYVEWANRAAIWVSWILPSEKRLIIRVHSYEAFTIHPMLINWANVNHLSSVSPHILSYLKDLCGLDKFDLGTGVIPNLNYLDEQLISKEIEEPLSLGMIGYNNKNKNLLLSLELISLLKERGLKPMLYLMGHPFDKDDAPEEEQAYFEKVERLIVEKSLEAHLAYIPFTPKIDEGIKKFNFILSTSFREGTHESLIQAMLRGTMPVIRKWPFLAQYESVEQIYDQSWIFQNADEMASFIEQTMKEGKLEELQDFAKEEAIKRYAFPVVLDQYKSLIIA